MLMEPRESPYDISFTLLGFQVRVTWTFWLAAAALGFGGATAYNQIAHSLGIPSPGAPVLLLIWVAAVFLSILVHELGHALAWRYYGANARIVLYHFGGLAVNNSFSAWNGARQSRIGPKESLVVSAAGPIAQLILAGLVVVVAHVTNLQLEIFGYSVGGENMPSTMALYTAMNFLFLPSVFWAVLNLLPVLPMDGGQILRNLLMMFRVNDAQHKTYIVSIGTAVFCAGLFMISGRHIAGIMFLFFAMSNWQEMTQGRGGFY